ncbi:MAG TPA: glutathione peroxidase [Polyangiaceae bacterium]|jgi:glutathione peroxidase|nr:glutathione peroxidase [Polyangiaceae bacterium]
MTTFHDFKVRTIDGKDVSLGDFAGKVLLVVNVASRCGLTPQYTALEELHRRYLGRGFSVVGFPSNDFGAQEPGTDAEIQAFCSTSYDVTFPMFSKIHVNGDAETPVYAFMKSVATAPKGPGDVTWNFEKFLVGKDGRVLARFAPPTNPIDGEIASAIEQAL